MKNLNSAILGLLLIATASCGSFNRRLYTGKFAATNNSNLPMNVLLNIHEGSAWQNCSALESNYPEVIPAHESAMHEITLDCVEKPDTWITFDLQGSKSWTLRDFSWQIRRQADTEAAFDELKPLADLFRSGKVLTWEGDVTGSHTVDVADHFKAGRNSRSVLPSVFPNLQSDLSIGLRKYNYSFGPREEHYFEPFLLIRNSLDSTITASIEFTDEDQEIYSITPSPDLILERGQLKFKLEHNSERNVPIAGRVYNSSAITCSDVDCRTEAL